VAEGAVTESERREARRLYQALLLRVRRLASGQSRRAVAEVDRLLAQLARALGGDIGRSTLSKQRAAQMAARISKLLDAFELDWAVVTRGTTRAILTGIVTEHRKVADLVADVAGVRKGGVAARIGRVPARVERGLRMMRGGKSVLEVARKNVEQVNTVLASYLKNAVGEMPSDEAMRGIQRMLRGQLPIDLGGSTKREVQLGLALPSKVERLIVTESFEGYRQGQAEALRAAPLKMVAHWDIFDESACEICQGIAKRDVGYGKGWYLPQDWPENPHPHCRCGQGDIRFVE
jgi:hypothetical protein